MFSLTRCEDKVASYQFRSGFVTRCVLAPNSQTKQQNKNPPLDFERFENLELQMRGCGIRFGCPPKKEWFCEGMQPQWWWRVRNHKLKEGRSLRDSGETTLLKPTCIALLSFLLRNTCLSDGWRVSDAFVRVVARMTDARNGFMRGDK